VTQAQSAPHGEGGERAQRKVGQRRGVKLPLLAHVDALKRRAGGKQLSQLVHTQLSHARGRRRRRRCVAGGGCCARHAARGRAARRCSGVQVAVRQQARGARQRQQGGASVHPGAARYQKRRQAAQQRARTQAGVQRSKSSADGRQEGERRAGCLARTR
jgi:hypothetical protein